VELDYLKKYHSSFLDGMKNTNENFSQYNQSFGWDFIMAPSVHKTETEISSKNVWEIETWLIHY